jgi:hypothetical protein
MQNYYWLKRFETLLNKHAHLDVISDIHSLNLEETWRLYIYLLEMEGK